MEEPRAPSSNRSSRSRDCFRESAGAWAPGAQEREIQGTLARAHTYEAAVAATARPDATRTDKKPAGG